MVRQSQSDKRDQTYRDSPTAWFAVLERARRDNDFRRAAEAERELRRLGVRVRFSRSIVEAAK
ncbi:MAG: hypothetical protein V2A79_19750 [Planctomycetota bacterium]